MSTKKTGGERRGPRDAHNVKIDQLELFAKRMQAEGARLLAILDYARAMNIDNLDVRNLPTFEHGIEQVASFISAVTKASSEATMKMPFKEQFDQIGKTKKKK